MGGQRNSSPGTRNQKVFEKVARELNGAGYERTYQQCRDKIKKLKGEYKKIKDKHGKTGEDRSNWDAMDSILGTRPATKPPIVIDTSNTAMATATDSQEEVEEETGEDKESETLSRSSSATSLAPSSVPSTSSSTNTSNPLPASRKRKRSLKPDGALVEMIEGVLQAQSKSDDRMMELEEKRLRMEERQLEREAQQRKEERDFQLQMMRLMMGRNVNPFNTQHLAHLLWSRHRTRLLWVTFIMLTLDRSKMNMRQFFCCTLS